MTAPNMTPKKRDYEKSDKKRAKEIVTREGSAVFVYGELVFGLLMEEDTREVVSDLRRHIARVISEEREAYTKALVAAYRAAAIAALRRRTGVIVAEIARGSSGEAAAP